MRLSEDELIARYFAPLAGPGGLGLRDDAALLALPPGQELVVTVDAIVAGVHFLPDDPPDTIAAKALGVNLSDLAAKGTDPLGYLLALALPDGWTETWLAAFAGGLAEAARAAGCDLLGGDTVRMPGPLSISITALGRVPAGRMVRRTTARPGDLIAVTGTIGDAALGLALASSSPRQSGEKSSRSSERPDEGQRKHAAPSGPPLTRSPASAGARPLPASGEREKPPWAAALTEADRAYLLDRYRVPRPRNALAASLRENASAAMDVSDGLAGDLAKMLRASGVSGTLALENVPLSPAARAALAVAPDLLPTLVGGGDDYEILLTVPPERRDALARDAAGLGLGLAVLGQVRSGEGPLAITRNGHPVSLASGSFRHF